MKYCVTWRWPKASLSVSSITCGWMPKRAAASRLMLMLSCGASFCCIGGDVGAAAAVSCSLAMSLRRPCVEFVRDRRSCNVYWNWPREMRPPTVMSCAGCRNSLAPCTWASLGRSRSMTCEAVALRSSRGFSR